MKELGGTDHPQRNAEKLQQGNRQNAKYSGAKTEHDKKTTADNLSLLLKAQSFSRKNIARILHNQKKNGFSFHGRWAA